jgi:hypothetical protein
MRIKLGEYMKRISAIITILSVMVLSSCSSLNKSYRSGAININVEANLDADVDVNMNRVLKGSAKEAELFPFPFLGGIKIKTAKNYLDGITYGGSAPTGWFGEDDMIRRAKSAAAYNAVKRHKDVHVLVAPRYIVSSKHYFFYKVVTVQVTGFAGTIKNFKKVKRTKIADLK